MVRRYKEQNEKAKRDIKDNVIEADFEYFRDLLGSSVSCLCKEGFMVTNKPTLDRKNNSKGHSKNNAQPCCR
jgi:hypothetical protein